MTDFRVERLAPGMYRVHHGGQSDTVYVAGPAADRWACWNGQVFRARERDAQAPRRAAVHHEGTQALTAPMPATVLKVLVAPGAAVRQGDTVVVLEAMKMELPIRAPGEAVVKSVHCREGELVQPDAVLVELES